MIVGIICTFFGISALTNILTRHPSPDVSSAYAAGQSMGYVLGILIGVVGVYQIFLWNKNR